MSADSQRLKSALRRIVLESPELRELLGDSDNRGDQAGSSGVGTSEAEESRLCCDGSTSDNANPGTDERDADADSQDGLDPDDPADLTSGDGTLSGVTDCATGEPVCFDGSGFIPPDGWDAPNEPPLDPTYTEGSFYYYRGNLDLSPVCCSASPTESLATSRFLDCTGRGSTSGFQLIQVTCAQADQANICVGNRNVACSPPEEETLVSAWPSDGCTNLAIVNGKIVGSKYDPENSSGDYSAPMDEIQLCSGGEQIGLKPAANGGWKTINATTDSGYLWDSHGRKIAHIDGNEYSDPDV